MLSKDALPVSMMAVDHERRMPAGVSLALVMVASFAIWSGIALLFVR